jgi:hypothetical protein
MKSGLSLLIILISHLSIFSQDTLFFINAGKMIVVVKEVSQTEIQYKKVELPDGPMYIISKNDIEKVVYKNGYSEIIKAPIETTTTFNSNNNTQVFAAYDPKADINTEKLTYKDTKRRYSSVVTLVDRHPDPNRRSSLMQSARTLKSFKKHRDGTRTGAIIFGGIAIGGVAIYTLAYAASAGTIYGDPGLLFEAPPVIFGTLALILGAASISFNINLNKKRNEFVRAYNE